MASMMVFARLIAHPLSALSGVMTSLANGHTDVQVEGAGRRDEIDPTAKSAEAFRLSLIERNRLEASTEEGRAAQHRRAEKVNSLIEQLCASAQDSSLEQIVIIR